MEDIKEFLKGNVVIKKKTMICRSKAELSQTSNKLPKTSYMDTRREKVRIYPFEGVYMTL